MAMQRYLGDDLRDCMRQRRATNTDTDIAHGPPEYPLEHLHRHHRRSHPEASHGSMHEMRNGTWSQTQTQPEDEKRYQTNSNNARVRTSFSGMMNDSPQAIEKYISPRTGMYLSMTNFMDVIHEPIQCVIHCLSLTYICPDMSTTSSTSTIMPFSPIQSMHPSMFTLLLHTSP